jgi:hypothetical protein
MRCVVLWLVGAAALAFPAHAQLYTEQTDTLFRAAYCVGVLSSAIKAAETSPEHRKLYESVCQMPSNYRATLPGMPTTEDFDACVREYMSSNVRQLHDKWQRYHDFVGIQLTSLPAGLQQRLFLITSKGSRDYSIGGERHKTEVMSCFDQCKGKESLMECVVDCVAKFDQTGANVMACSMLPDKLPF